MHTSSSGIRPKDTLRLLQLGERDFWEIAHNIRHDTDTLIPTCRTSLQNAHIHVWCANAHTDEAQSMLTLLQTFAQNIPGLTVERHDVDNMGADTLTHTVAALPASALHVACGFTEIFLDVLSSAAQGPCLTGTSTIGAPYAALGELAFIQHTTQDLHITLDTIRVCWLGGVNGLGQSLMEAAIYAPFELFMCIPPWGDPDHHSTGLALKAGAKIFLTREPDLAVDGAHLVYLDETLVQERPHKTLSPLGPAHFHWTQNTTIDLDPLLQERATEAVFTVPIHLPAQSADTVQSQRNLTRLKYHEAALLALLSRMACWRQS